MAKTRATTIRKSDRAVLEELARRARGAVEDADLVHDAVRLLAFRAGTSWRRVLREIRRGRLRAPPTTADAPPSA